MFIVLDDEGGAINSYTNAQDAEDFLELYLNGVGYVHETYHDDRIDLLDRLREGWKVGEACFAIGTGQYLWTCFPVGYQEPMPPRPHPHFEKKYSEVIIQVWAQDRESVATEAKKIFLTLDGMPS
jgi:DNA-binding SARP family transcriptional activator